MVALFYDAIGYKLVKLFTHSPKT